MKLILVVLTFAGVYGAFSTNILPKDFLVPQITYTSITAVSNAITNAIGNVTLWKGGKSDTRLELLNELKTFQFDLEELMRKLTEDFLNGTEYRSLLLALDIYLQIHLNKINILITILIPTMEDLTATDAITSSLDVVRATKLAMENIHILISSIKQ
jgi:hypothetical protein